MLEEAITIFDYLPIEAGSEKLYTQHLWEAFTAIVEKGDPAKSFAIMPFHLLFMLAAQYKVYKLSDSHKAEYLKKISIKLFIDKPISRFCKTIFSTCHHKAR